MDLQKASSEAIFAVRTIQSSYSRNLLSNIQRLMILDMVESKANNESIVINLHRQSYSSTALEMYLVYETFFDRTVTDKTTYLCSYSNSAGGEILQTIHHILTSMNISARISGNKCTDDNNNSIVLLSTSGSGMLGLRSGSTIYHDNSNLSESTSETMMRYYRNVIIRTGGYDCSTLENSISNQRFYSFMYNERFSFTTETRLINNLGHNVYARDYLLLKGKDDEH
ncbi:hypothetical protein EJP02_272 [Escherichia phage EJP2]|nr:hypothetical protein EJP02_272 [Escherichia phage EJP2]